MSENNNDKKTIWIYAVILFTSAFIVLLLTAYSQIKFNKNIDDYKYQLSNREKEKINFQSNLSSAIEEKEKIKNQLEKLKGSVEEEKKKKEDIDKSLSDYKTKVEKTVSAYEALIEAGKLYKDGNIIDCALKLKRECNSVFLEKEGINEYNRLIEKTIDTASNQLYIDGYKLFIKKEYESSINKLNLSIEIADDKYYSDDSLYFIAYAQYYLGDIEVSKKTAKEFLEKYPDSNYVNHINELLK